MPVFGLARTFFTPLAVGRTLINIGRRGMSSISSVFLENFTRKLTEEPLVFRKIKPNANGIRFISSYEDIPISIRVNNEDFPETPLYTVSAEFSTEKDQKVLKDLFFAENVYQLPKAWQIPRNQPKPDTSFHPK